MAITLLIDKNSCRGICWIFDVPKRFFSKNSANLNQFSFYKYTMIIGTGLNTTFFIVIAAVGIVDASIKMFSQVDLKKLVAFCTVQEMNMIYMMLC